MNNLTSLADVISMEQTPYCQQNIASSTYAALKLSAEAHGSNTALTFFADAGDFKTHKNISYQQLLANINRTANMLRDFGVQREDVVAFVLPNLPETHYVIWGAEAAGIAMGLNPLLEARHLHSLLQMAKAKYLVCLAPTPGYDIWDKCLQASKDNKQLQGIFTVELKGGQTLATKVGSKTQALKQRLSGIKPNAPVYDFHQQQAQYNPAALDFPEPEATDIASYFCTGGTTDLPKIAKRQHAAEVYNAWAINAFNPRDFAPGSSIFCGLPLSHANGQIVTGLTPWMFGGKVVLGTPRGYRSQGLVQQFWAIVEHYKITMFSGVPALYARLVNTSLENRDISSLRKAICGASPLPKALHRQFIQHTGIPLAEGYGLTEGTCASSINPGMSKEDMGSIGFRLPYQDMRVVRLDTDGYYQRDALENETGTITISGPNVFAGYVDPKHESQTWLMRKGQTWLNTGDLGYQDHKGHFWLTGRQKDLIIRSGHNIDPRSIEEAIQQHPAICQVAAIGRPDAYAGEVPVLYIELNPEQNLDNQVLLNYAQQQIQQKAAWPKSLKILDKLPLTPVGKVCKQSLRKMELESLLTQLVMDTGCHLTQLQLKQTNGQQWLAVITLESEPYQKQLLEQELSQFTFNFTLLDKQSNV